MLKLISALILAAFAATILPATTVWTGPGSTVPYNVTLPRERLDPRPPTVTGARLNVGAAQMYHTPQDAWDAAGSGDEIVIYIESFTNANPAINFTYKMLTSPITIRSVNSANLPVGVRAGSANAADMPTLVVTGTNTPVFKNDWANGTAALRAANNIYVIGLHLKLGSAVTQNYGLVELESGGNLTGLPYNITFDRMWIEPDHIATGAQDFVRGMIMEGRRIAVINSTVEKFSSPNLTADSQAIWIYGDAEFVLLRNNDINAATEPLMFGGGGNGYIPSQVRDAEVSFNYIHKDASFLTAGTNAKNCAEWKTGLRVLIHNNVSKDCFSNVSQSGACALFTSRDSQSGVGSVLKDILYIHNLCDRAGQAFQINDHDEYCTDLSSTVTVTGGTSVQITAGSILTALSGTQAALRVTIAGVATTSATITDTTHFTVSDTLSNGTGKYMYATYPCDRQSGITIRNSAFLNLSTVYNNANSTRQADLAARNVTIDHVTITTEGTGSDMATGWHFPAIGLGANVHNIAILNSIIAATNLSYADGFGFYIGTYLRAPYNTGYGLARNNVLATNFFSSDQQTSWALIGSGNAFPTSMAAVGLLASGKELDPNSTYWGTGAGAHLLCLPETEIIAGTIPADFCKVAIR